MVGGVGDSTRLCEEREKMKVEEKMEKEEGMKREYEKVLNVFILLKYFLVNIL